MMRPFALAITALMLAACWPSRPDAMKKLAEEQAISAQKDSMLLEVSRNASFINDVSKQLDAMRSNKAGSKAVKSGELENDLTPSQGRAYILAQVKNVAERLDESERRLAESRRRVVELTGSDAAKSKRLASFDSVSASFRSIIETQRSQIADLSARVQTLADENQKLKSENVQLTSTTQRLTTERDSLTTEQNTVYYVAGTRDELMSRHVIENVGGFLGIGRTPVPARNLDPTAFTPVDMRTATYIALPQADRKYKIITRQNVAALATPPDAKGRLPGTFTIREPQTFWAGSKFLILVAQ